ncbi:T9SS C-terminal target domain-containing protein [Pontibacter diazotrophicus]|uniref:T9SS C-terminal target domain-containing protein n=2 Tax=Pontibacter diazotrophicus TaxID=1400979 RepID=A0A3D8LF07_9BACT|nr:T9SS C-terminal target domain-containing protein [Pontibacter diazotrophicus]
MSVLMVQAQARTPAQVQAAQQAEKENPLNLASGNEDVAIYPNPSTGVFTVELNNLDTRKVELRIMNVIGNEILRETLTSDDVQFKKTVDLNSFAKGLYYVKIEADNYSTVRRVVVK